MAVLGSAKYKVCNVKGMYRNICTIVIIIWLEHKTFCANYCDSACIVLADV